MFSSLWNTQGCPTAMFYTRRRVHKIFLNEKMKILTAIKQKIRHKYLHYKGRKEILYHVNMKMFKRTPIANKSDVSSLPFEENKRKMNADELL